MNIPIILPITASVLQPYQAPSMPRNISIFSTIISQQVGDGAVAVIAPAGANQVAIRTLTVTAGILGLGHNLVQGVHGVART